MLLDVKWSCALPSVARARQTGVVLYTTFRASLGFYGRMHSTLQYILCKEGAWSMMCTELYIYSICVLPYHCTIRRIDDSRWHLCLKYANMPGASKHIHGTVQYGTLRTRAASMRPSGLFQRE